MSYHSWDSQKIEDYTESKVSEMYANGFVFTRIDRGVMNQTRSVRIDLKNFDLSSENRRVLRKVEGMGYKGIMLPVDDDKYDWHIHKLGKDFYLNKFGDKLFSASKIKELITSSKSNFNLLMKFDVSNELLGYAICYQNKTMMHYAFPFYHFETFGNNYGMGMMLNAILSAKESNKEYIYLGSATRTTDKYKLQFKGLEWFDGKEWKADLEELKEILVKSPNNQT